MKLNVIKVNPVDNMTIFVMDRLEPSNHIKIANKLMEYGNVHGEQVGFIEEPITAKGKSLNTLRLQMMGGEFCGNATRSLAALIVHLNLPMVNKTEDLYNVILEVSGINELLECTVRKTEIENSYFSKVQMPLPKSVVNSAFQFYNKMISYIRVDFPGITHFIVESKDIKDKEGFFKAIKDYTDQEELDAIGIMFYDSITSFLTPLVYVRSTDSLYWERSCASGTSALGVALALRRNSSLHEYIKQPGGELEVVVKLENDKVNSLYLDGSVKIVFEGIAYIDDKL
ncbi:diaminopimelate epimerase [Tissierella creatinini]|nr:diaminopimelate epimerase [Tissierella creatinini]TJX67515.1 diaminopimelate epimerase [Soehngenia saccharolytica]